MNVPEFNITLPEVTLNQNQILVLAGIALLVCLVVAASTAKKQTATQKPCNCQDKQPSSKTSFGPAWSAPATPENDPTHYGIVNDE